VTTQRRPPERSGSLHRRALAGALMVVYAVLLHESYRNLIAPVFSYLGQTYREPDVFATALSIALTVVLGMALPTNLSSATDFILWTFYLIAVAPSILIAQYADILPRDRALWMSLWIAGVFLLMVWFAQHAMPLFTIRIDAPPALVTLAAVGFTVLFTGLLVALGGASFQLVALDAVQDVRVSYKSALTSIPFLGYAVQFQTAVLNPIFMAVGVVRRKLLVVTAGVVGQLLIYSVTGYKLTALSPIFVIALAWYLSRTRGRLTSPVLVLAITGTMTASLLLDHLSGGRFFVTIFVNRLMAGPGVLTSAFFLVFEDQPKYQWAHSFLSPILDSPYALTPGYLVGRVFQNVDSQANVNLFGDGYANLGLVGVCIEAAFLLGVLTLLNAASRGVPLAITAPSSLVAALGLANNSAFTSVLTGGFGGLILAFALWPRGQDMNDEGELLPSGSGGRMVSPTKGRLRPSPRRPLRPIRRPSLDSDGVTESSGPRVADAGDVHLGSP
jgi:hypothetical protein